MPEEDDATPTPTAGTQRLGVAAGDVGWTRVTFNNAIAPGPKPYDFDINQSSITDERRHAVDFSAPYHLVRQTVIAVNGDTITRLRLAQAAGAPEPE